MNYLATNRPYLARRTFWIQSAERAIKTFAQALTAALAIVPLGEVTGVDLLGVTWTTALSLAGGAALLSLLTSVASGPIGPAGTPSLVATTNHADAGENWQAWEPSP